MEIDHGEVCAIGVSEVMHYGIVKLCGAAAK
jgi:hypothetical protein